MKRRSEVSCDYSEARQEIAKDHFAGDSAFTIHDALDAAKTSSGFPGGGSSSEVFQEDRSDQSSDED